MPLDVARVRAETPATQRLIHFNNAGASLMPRPVLNTVQAHLQLETDIGGYEAAAREKDRIEATYDALATLIGAQAQEIALIENATRAWDMAFYSFNFSEGDKILTAQAEYSSNYLAYLQVARKTGAVIQTIPDDDSGQLDVLALENAIDERVKLIAVTHIPTHGGLVNPAKEIGHVANQAGIPYLLDACQSVGQMPVNVNDLGCDILSGTGRKYLRGPRGTGFLYVRESLLHKLEPPFIDNHAAAWTGLNEFQWSPDARRFETWEKPHALHLGLGEAARYALDIGLDAIWQRVQALAGHLRDTLRDVPGVTLRDLGRVQCGIVTFTAQQRTPEDIKALLTQQNPRMNVSVSNLRRSHLDLSARGLPAVVRASVHYFNTEEEIQAFGAALREVLGA